MVDTHGLTNTRTCFVVSSCVTGDVLAAELACSGGGAAAAPEPVRVSVLLDEMPQLNPAAAITGNASDNGSSDGGNNNASRSSSGSLAAAWPAAVQAAAEGGLTWDSSLQVG